MTTPVWTPTRAAALDHLDHVLPRLGRDYAALRNYDFGPERRDNISCLSPWIRHRLLTEEEVLKAVIKTHGTDNAAAFISEVFWRGYFKGWLERRPEIWARYLGDLAVAQQRLAEDSSRSIAHQMAVSGQTGIDCFDAWAKELTETGYLHNHARMWFASIWIFTLRLPWVLGANFLLKHLLDGDPASNTLSWRWVGGLHTAGKTYLARAENITKFTDGRFAPQGLAQDAVPLIEASPPPAAPPPPAIDLPTGRAGYVLHSEDCHPAIAMAGPVLSLTALNGGLSLSERFRDGALNDQAARMQAPVCKTTDWGAAISDWADENEICDVISAYAPVGPTADLLADAPRRLAEGGIRLHVVPRLYDLAVWPHAGRGFFALKKKIPQILGELAI